MNITRCLLTALFLLSFSVISHAQDEFSSCGANTVHERLLAKDPKYRSRQQMLEAAWSTHRSIGPSAQKSTPPYTLPIVFHIVHENGTENITDADVLRTLEFTNQAFANTDYYDQGTGTDTQIQFCLARRSPDNQPTAGINRIVSPLTDVDSDTEDLALKDLIRWEPREYINVWVVKEICGLGLSCGVAGYAYYPGAHGGRRDGIVVEARWLAGDEARATVLVHELGHYLGLRHTFDGGCQNDDCTVDGDAVCDTPPDGSKASVPCGGTANSCTTDTDSGFATDQNDMFINYMDYGSFRCYSAFTPGQRDRMHFFTAGRRRSLLESFACQDPCPAAVTAGFTGGNDTINIGDNVIFTNLSTNGDNYIWKLDDTPFAGTEDVDRTFTDEGTFTVKLVAESNDGLCAADSVQQRITVVCPVITDFMLPEVTFLKPDTAYVFENTSVATTDRIWSVNGSDVATTADLSINFPTPGLYTICLSANNGFCEDDHCRSVFVREPPCTGPGCAEDCGGPFLFPYLTTGGALTSGQFYQVIPFAGGYYAAGGMNNQPMVVALDEAGALLWQIELFPELPSGFVSRLLLDQDGNLTGIGTSGYANGSGVQQTGSFAFKLDARNGDLLWARQYGSQQAVVQFTDLTHSAPGADYFLCGYLQDFGAPGGRTALTLFLDPADGTIRSANTFPATGGPNDLLDLTYDPTRDRYYAVGYQEGGISGRGLAVLALDGAGALAWSSQLTETLGGSFPANLASIDQDDDELVVLSPSQSTATGATASLWRVAKADGLLSERLRYTLPAGTLAGQITSLSDGYQCAGVLPDGEPILWRTDKAGIPIWASIYPDLGGGDFTLTGSGQVLLATSWREDPARFPTVTRLGADGAVPADCLEEEPIDVSFGPLLARNPPATLSTIPVNISSFEFFAEPGSLSLSPENCREECPEENPCLAPLLTNYESTENLSGNSNVRALVADTARTYLSVVNQSGGSVIAVDGNGEISWQVRMQASNLYLDREGNLIAHDARNIARFRANDGTVLWSQELTGENVTWGIRRAYVPDAGDGIALFGLSTDPGGGETAVAFTAINLQTGAVNIPLNILDNNRNLRLSYDLVFAPSVETFYFLSQFSPPSPDYVLTAVDVTGVVQWQRQYAVTGFNGGWNPELVLQDNGIVVTDHDPDPGHLSSYAYKLDFAGTVQWAREYPGLQGFYDAAANPAGIVITASKFGEPGLRLTQLGPTGIAQWSLALPDLVDYTGTDEALLTRGNTISLGASGTDDGGQRYATFLRIPTDFSQIPDCINWSEDSDLPLSVPAEVGFTNYRVSVRQADVTAVDRPLGASNYVLREPACRGDCPEVIPEICDNQIDDDQDGLTDCEDPDLANTCCCLPAPTLSLGPDTTVCYPHVIRAGAVDTAWTLNWSNGADADSLFVDEPGEYWLTATDSCGRTVSDTLTLHPRPRPLLELGPDTTLCSNAVVPFRAQDGFAEYTWIDGTADQLFTAFEAGTYWVVATDSCGGVQTDTVRVFVDPVTEIDLGPDTTICPGDTLRFALTGFDNYQWSPSTFLDCDNCPEVSFTPDRDTVLLVAADLRPGCISSDSLVVTVAAATGQRDTAFLCVGDSLFLPDDTLTIAGQYYFPGGSTDCVTTDTLDVFLRSLPSRRDSLRICAGTTAEIFGNPESEPGTYERTFTNAGGCDSFVQVILTVEPTPQTFDTISICAGGTVDIFGNPESEAGTYERTFPNAAGCDSFVQVVLTVIPPQQTVDTISICVGTEVDIFGTPRSEAGTYERNFTNTAGCDSIARIVLTLETALETFDTLRICPGDSLLVFGDFVREAGPYSASFTTVGGCDSTHNVEVQVEEAVVAIAIQTESACDGAAAGAGEVLTGNSGGSPSIRWSTGDTTATVTGLAVGRYAVTVTAPDGCSTSDSLLILPGETVPLTLEPAPEACLGDANGSLLIVGDHTDLAFSLDGGTTLQSTGQFTELAAGDYLLTVLDSTGCDQEMPFTIEAGTEIFLDLPEDQVLALGDSLTLRPTTNQLPPLLHWLASDGDSCIACPEYALRPLETTTVFATTLGDCPAVDSTRVSVISENLVYVPNAFSPNKDGVNDLFRIFPGPAVDRMLSVAVYDRWGNQVFLRDNPDPDSLLDAWDGTIPDGQDPGVGVYVYRLRVLLLDGTEKELSGDLTLLR